MKERKNTKAYSYTIQESLIVYCTVFFFASHFCVIFGPVSEVHPNKKFKQEKDSSSKIKTQQMCILLS